MPNREKPTLDMSEGSATPADSTSDTSQFEEVESSVEEESSSNETYQPEHLNADAPIENERPSEEPRNTAVDVSNENPPEEPRGPAPCGDISAPKAMVVLAVAVVAALLGWLTYPKAVIPCAIISLLISTALLSIFRSLRFNRWILHTILLGISIAGYTVVLCGFYPLWHENFRSYGDNIVKLAEKTGKTVSTGTEADNKIVETPVKVVRATTTVMEGYLHLDLKQRLLIVVQMTLFSTTIFLLVLVIILATPGLGKSPLDTQPSGLLAWLGPGAFRCVNGIGLFSLSRALKAIVICLICGLGLRLSGFQSAPFIAGAVFCVALISYLSPVVAGLLGAAAILGATTPWYIAGGGLAATCIVLSVAEKKLYWFMRLFPFFGKYLPERSQGPGAIGKTVGIIARVIPHLLSFAMLAAVVFFCYQVYKVYELNVDRAQAVKEADNLMKKNNDWQGAHDLYYDIAFNKYSGHPANLRICHKIMECQLKAGRYKRAAQWAKTLASYDPAKPTELRNPEKPEDLKESGKDYLKRFRFETAKLLADKAIKKHRADEGYEVVIKAMHKLDMPELLTQLGQETLAINETNLWGLLAAARGAHLAGKHAEAIAHCRKGLSQKPSDLELLHVQANAHLALGQYDECINLCEKILEYAPEDTAAQSLMTKAMQAKENGAVPEDNKAEDVPDPIPSANEIKKIPKGAGANADE